MELKAPGAQLRTESPQPQIDDEFGSEEGFTLQLVTRDGEQHLVYKSYKGYEEFYGSVRVYRIEPDGLRLLWLWRYAAEDGEGLEEDENISPHQLNTFLDQRADALFKAACEDPLGMMTQCML